MATCPVCGREFRPTPYQMPAIRAGKIAYCSTRCRERKPKKPSSALVPCSRCGTMFEPHYGQMRRVREGKTVYCSRACASEAADRENKIGWHKRYDHKKAELKRGGQCRNPDCGVFGKLEETAIQPSGYCLICERERARGLLGAS